MSAPAVPRASASDLLGWRMRALGLAPDAVDASTDTPADIPAGSGADRIAAVASTLLALQGQDWNAVRWALGVRAPGTTLADLHDAFADGQLVRSWPMRGTIHVVAAEDIGWMQAATNHRVLPGAPKRRATIGLDDDSLARMTDVAIAELTGGKRLSRTGLIEAWERAGIDVPGPWRYHVIWWLCQNQILVQGPVDDDEPLLVLAEEWITHPRQLAGDEALAELAARFARGRGPVLEKDLAWWTGLTIRESRRAIAAAHDAGRLAPVDIDAPAGTGVALVASAPRGGGPTRHWADPALLDAPAADPAADGRALLLPGFDEYLLGYTERAAMLDPEHFERIVPGRNGVFRGTVVEAGRVTGTWQRKLLKHSARIEATPFPGRAFDAAALAPSAAAWGAFHGLPAEATIGDTDS